MVRWTLIPMINRGKMRDILWGDPFYTCVYYEKEVKFEKESECPFAQEWNR